MTQTKYRPHQTTLERVAGAWKTNLENGVAVRGGFALARLHLDPKTVQEGSR